MSLMGRTRMQRALPITWADKIAAWRAPLTRHHKRLQELKPRLLVVQFGGPVGTLEKLGDKGPSVAAALASRLDLAVPAGSWQQRARYAGGVRRLAVPADRQSRQDWTGHRAHGAK